MKLRLRGISADCVIGERPEERKRQQRLRVDAELEIADTAADTDELSDTVDYAALTEAIRARLRREECRMIERAAKVVCEECMADGKVSAARVTVCKAGAVENLECAEAIYELQRS